MKTPMQELFNQLEIDYPNLFNTNTLEGKKFINDYFKFIELEKMHLITAHGNQERKSSGVGNYTYTLTGETYYNEIYNKMETKLKELTVNGIIDLGCMNGWSKEKWDLYKELDTLTIEGSSRGRNLGRCYNESSFDVNIDGQVITVITTVDSSD